MIKTIDDLDRCVSMGMEESVIREFLPVGVEYEKAMDGLVCKKFMDTLTKLGLASTWAE